MSLFLTSQSQIKRNGECTMVELLTCSGEIVCTLHAMKKIYTSSDLLCSMMFLFICYELRQVKKEKD
jgi:hypothetical protein